MAAGGRVRGGRRHARWKRVARRASISTTSGFIDLVTTRVSTPLATKSGNTWAWPMCTGGHSHWPPSRSRARRWERRPAAVSIRTPRSEKSAAGWRRAAAGWRGGSLSVWRNAAIASAAVRRPAGSATTDGGGPVGPSFMSEKTTSRVALPPSAVSSGGSTQKRCMPRTSCCESSSRGLQYASSASRLGADDASCSSAASATQSAPGIRGHSAQLGGHTAAGSGGGGSGSVVVVAGEP